MSDVKISVAHLRFTARFEEAAAPRTCAAFRALMPFSQQLIQTRWSGEAAWVPMGDLDLGIPCENATSHPSRGDILFYPRGASETELIFAYGSCSFSSKVGTARREPLSDADLGMGAVAGARTAGALEGRAADHDRGRLAPMTTPRELLERYVQAKD